MTIYANDPESYLDLEVAAGADYICELTYKNQAGQIMDLDGHTARMQIRPSAASSTIHLDLTTENGLITINGSLGLVRFKIPAAESEAWAFRKAVYDLEIVSTADEVTRLCKGNVYVDPNVTK